MMARYRVTAKYPMVSIMSARSPAASSTLCIDGCKLDAFRFVVPVLDICAMRVAVRKDMGARVEGLGPSARGMGRKSVSLAEDSCGSLDLVSSRQGHLYTPDATPLDLGLRHTPDIAIMKPPLYY